MLEMQLQHSQWTATDRPTIATYRSILIRPCWGRWDRQSSTPAFRLGSAILKVWTGIAQFHRFPEPQACLRVEELVKLKPFASATLRSGKRCQPPASALRPPRPSPRRGCAERAIRLAHKDQRRAWHRLRAPLSLPNYTWGNGEPVLARLPQGAPRSCAHPGHEGFMMEVMPTACAAHMKNRSWHGGWAGRRTRWKARRSY